MCQYTGNVHDSQCYNKTPLTDKEVNLIVKSLLGEPQEVCNKTGLSPFCVLNPAPADDSPFWKKRITATSTMKKKIKAAKPRGPGRPKKQIAQELLELDDSEGEAETSQAGVAEKQQHDSRRQTQSGGSEDLVAGLSNIPVPRKRLNEETPPSSGDSTGTQLPAFVVNPGAKAKMRKKQKVCDSSKTSKVSEPEKEAPKPREAPIQSSEDPISQQDNPPLQADEIFPGAMDMDADPTNIYDLPSPVPPQPTEEIPLEKNTADVVITRVGYKTLGASTVLAKHK